MLTQKEIRNKDSLQGLTDGATINAITNTVAVTLLFECNSLLKSFQIVTLIF
jgi:hypothetical protein